MQRSEQNDSQRIESDSTIHTGTTTVGLTADEGVVMATDMRATLGGRFVSSKDVQKVEQIHPTAALTIAGTMSGAQALISSLRAEANLYEARRGERMSMTALSTVVANSLRDQRYPCQPIVGGVDETGPHVYEYDAGGGVMEDEYAALGSGMQLAYGVLEQEYTTGLPLDAASDIAAKAVRSAIERDTASGNGVYLAEITNDGVNIVGHSLEKLTQSAS